ncbi:MAG: acyl-CoA thioesterase [Pseudomonadales bacterium]|nr:acyl-CoA thioesterase [Pseudomonadales bacterium]
MLIQPLMNENTEIDWQYPNPYLTDINVSPEDTDRLGHTNNVRYLAWLEDAAWGHITELGLGWDVKEARGRAMAIVRTEVDYLAASYAGDHLLLGTWITSSDFKYQSTREFQLVRYQDHKVVLRAKMQFACIVLKSGRLSKMPVEFVTAHRAGLEAAGVPC